MILKLAVRNIISRRSSIIIILFITFTVTMFCVANAVFDSTEQGVQKTYATSFTGDIFIRPKAEAQLSLFGDETPVTGELTQIDTISPYGEIRELLQNNPKFLGFTPQVTCMTSMEANGNRIPVYAFGIEVEEYLSLMDSIEILEGKPFAQGEKGLMLTDRTASRLGVSAGQEVQFVVVDGPDFRIRAAPVSAIYKYTVHNDIFDRFVLLDGDTVRSLLDLESGVYIAENYIEEDDKNLIESFEDFDDFDSLFDEVSDTSAVVEFVENGEIMESDKIVYEGEIAVDAEINAEANLDDSFDESVAEVAEGYIPSATWNYLIVKVKPDVNVKKEIRNLKSTFRKKGWPVDAADWRHAAGSISLYLYWLRLIFNIGIAIILVAGFIIVNNTLVVNVLDRTSEIGTLRALGARKRFISFECMAETFIMTLTGGFFGVLFAEIICHFITKANIVLKNSFLIQLFGSDALQVYVNGDNILKMIILVVLLGLIGWVYPVINAVKISPVKAMQGAR